MSRDDTTPLTKRQHALHELLSSERAYASDLALVRQIHIPLALGQSIPHSLPISPPPSSGSSSRTVSTVSSSSLPATEKPMTPDDVKIIFNNITEIAVFSDLFCLALQEALGDLLDGGKGDDHVGALFLSIIPELEKPYKHYITRHPTALTHLQSLPQTPALQSYLSQTQTISSSLSHAWDLSSLLIKPVQRLLKYPLLLTAIIDETPDSHSDKLNLKDARKQLEEVARNVNEGRRRAEVVREVLTNKKKPPGPGVTVAASVNLTKMKSLRVTSGSTAGTPNTSGSQNGKGETVNGSGTDDQTPEEALLVSRLEQELKSIEDFSQQFAKHIVEWARMTSNVVLSLRNWAIGFSKVIGLTPDQGSEAFDAFLSIVEKQLMPLCVNLEAVINERVLKELAHLLTTMTQPLKLLTSMNEQEPYHHHLMNMTVSPKNRPPPSLLAASTNYLALRGQLATELPTYISLLHKGLRIFIHRLSAIQTEFYAKVRDHWLNLWEMLRLEEELNVGHEETVNVWKTRWNDVHDALCGMTVVNDPKLVYKDLRALVHERREREGGGGRDDAEYYALHHLQTFTPYQSNAPSDTRNHPQYDLNNVPIPIHSPLYVVPPSSSSPSSPNFKITSPPIDRRDSRDRDHHHHHHNFRSHSHSRPDHHHHHQHPQYHQYSSQYQHQRHHSRERGNNDRSTIRERDWDREKKKSAVQVANALSMLGSLDSSVKSKQQQPDGSPLPTSSVVGVVSPAIVGRARGNSDLSSGGSFMSNAGIENAFGGGGGGGGSGGGIPTSSGTGGVGRGTGGKKSVSTVSKKSSNESLVSKTTVRSPQPQFQYHQHHHHHHHHHQQQQQQQQPSSHSPRPTASTSTTPRQPMPHPHRRRTTGGIEPAPEDLREYEVMMMKEQQERVREREFGGGGGGGGYVASSVQYQRSSTTSGRSGGDNAYSHPHTHPYHHQHQHQHQHLGLPRTKSMPLPYHPQSSSQQGHRDSGMVDGGGERKREVVGEWSEYVEVEEEEDSELFYQATGIDPGGGGYEYRSARPRERKDAVISSQRPEKPMAMKSHSQTRKEKRNSSSSSSRKRSGSIKSITSFFTRDNNPVGDISILSTTATTPSLIHASSSSLTTTTTDHTPSPRDSWALKPAKYTCIVIHPCKPPTTGPNSTTPLSYFSFPFFTLKEGELYDVLQEAGHPSLHPNLPLIVDDEGEDCLLLCRSVVGGSTNSSVGDRGGDGMMMMKVGWALASFLKPCGELDEEV